MVPVQGAGLGTRDLDSLWEMGWGTERAGVLGCGRSEILADALRCCSCTTSPEAPTTTVETLP